jgi:hypothetical protein
MRKLAPLLFAGLVVTVVSLLSAPSAHAQSKCGNDICTGGSQKGRLRVLQGLTIEGGPVHADGGPTITFSGKGTLVYDFPSVPATGAGSGCQDSAAGTATGCTFGDTLMLGIDQVPPTNLNAGPPVAYISAANAFKVRVCNDSTDAGAVDWPDASYTVRCFR